MKKILLVSVLVIGLQVASVQAQEQTVFGYDISTPIAEMSFEKAKSELEELKKITQQTDLLRRFNENKATNEEREQMTMLTNRMDELVVRKLSLMMEEHVFKAEDF